MAGRQALELARSRAAQRLTSGNHSPAMVWARPKRSALSGELADFLGGTFPLTWPTSIPLSRLSHGIWRARATNRYRRTGSTFIEQRRLGLSRSSVSVAVFPAERSGSLLAVHPGRSGRNHGSARGSLQLRDVYDPDRTIPGKINTRWGGFVEQV